MKWIRHMSDSHTNSKMRILIRKHGIFGYGLCWVCRELVAKDGVDFKIAKEKEWQVTLSEITKQSWDKLQDIMNCQSELGLIDSSSFKEGDLYIPKLEEYLDEYTRKRVALTGYYQDSVRRVSHSTLYGFSSLYKETIKEVIDYLNHKTNKMYRVNSRDNQSIIVARLKEDYTIGDLKKVIDNMTDRWLGDEKMEQYLRPSTLFRVSKIEGYLNADKGLVNSWNKKESMCNSAK